MTSKITSLVGVSTLLTVGAMLWLAVWSYRRFGITIFAWLVIKQISTTSASLFNVTLHPEETRLYIESYQRQLECNAGEVLMSFTGLMQLFSVLSMLCITALAAGELANLGSRAKQGYQPHALLATAFRGRYVLGAVSVILAVGPTLVTAYLIYGVPT